MSRIRAGRELSNKTKNNLLVLMHAIFRHAVKLYDLPANPLASVDRFRVRSSGDIQVFSPEEVWALVPRRVVGDRCSDLPDRGFHRASSWRAARAALARRRLCRLDDPRPRQLRRRPADNAEIRKGPGGADGARRRRARWRSSDERERFTGEDDFVFVGEHGLPLDGDALSSRYRDALARAELRPLRFHDLRHTFGTRMIRQADIRRVQEWMGHADIQTTMKYLHYESRPEDAQLVARAFAASPAVKRACEFLTRPTSPSPRPTMRKGCELIAAVVKPDD